MPKIQITIDITPEGWDFKTKSDKFNYTEKWEVIEEGALLKEVEVHSGCVPFHLLHQLDELNSTAGIIADMIKDSNKQF